MRYLRIVLIISAIFISGFGGFIYLDKRVKPVVQPANPEVVNDNSSKENNKNVQYPDLPTKYIQAVSWPPQVAVIATPFSCKEGSLNPNGLPENVASKNINGRTYCVTSLSQGAAGSTYTDYLYTTLVNNNLVNIKFTLRYPQCNNYPDPQKTECTNERKSFNLDLFVNQVMENLH